MELERLALYDEHMKIANVVPTVLFSFFGCQILSAQEVDPSKVLAEFKSTRISMGDLEKAASEKLEQLGIQRLRFDAQQVRKRHQLLKTTLDQLISQELLRLEAEAQGLGQEQLLENEVNSKMTPPTDEELEKYYQRNKKRFKGSKEEVMPHLRKYLERDRTNKARAEFIQTLKEKYDVQDYFEPLRISVGSDGSPFLGPTDAPVTIVEFSDFECPHCSKLAKNLHQVEEQYRGKVRLVFRQFPLNSIHRNAQKAAEAALCAADQDKFWELHDLMFSDQKKLTVQDLKDKAETLGLQIRPFQECLDTGKYAAAVKEDLLDGVRAGVSGTPAIFVNGRPFSGAATFAALSRIIDEELGADSQYASQESSH
jgi:protein-disulfide isomerase